MRRLAAKFTFVIVAVGTAVGTVPGINRAANADVTLVRNGTAQAAIYAAAEVMAADRVLPEGATSAATQTEADRRRLRESVKDLALYLGRMSGAKVEVVIGAPQAGDQRRPILIGSLAAQRFGPPAMKSPYKQGWRMVVSERSIGLLGESDEATSYAIYEMLDRLGCRWYIPGDMGEVIPQRKSISLPNVDVSDVPDTYFRTIWYADDAFKRRNRMGGVIISAGHALEHYVTKEQREQHPEWRAVINGKPHDVRLKWSHPGVQQAIADAILAHLDKQYTHTISLSPDDGGEFDESDDRAWDAGDTDTSVEAVSLTDRYIRFCNIVAEKVTKKYPNVLFGFLAYVQYTRPPVREKPHPNLIPQIAPITYCRAHAMTDTHICPSRPQIRAIVEGWAKVSPRISYYNYMFHLAEAGVPYPMMHQMKEELPILYKNNVKFWQPETIPNFESVQPGKVLTIRKAWNTQENSNAYLDEFFTRFYGAAAKPMRRYWQRFDRAWVEHPEHAGSHLSYLARFKPSMLQAARADIDAARAAAKTDMERRRVKLIDDSLSQFELYMKMRRDLAEGRLTNLAEDGDRWFKRQVALGDQYAANYAFGKMHWTTATGPGLGYKGFNEATYNDGDRIATNYNIIAPPLRLWRYATDKEKRGEALGWSSAAFGDISWKVTDLGVDTWSSLGIDKYMGRMWYRHNAHIGELPAGKKSFLWVSSMDGEVRVFVNGQPVPHVNEKGEQSPVFNGYSVPASFDITAALKPNAENQITILGTRLYINELGSGGLLSPVYLYQEK